MKYTCSCGKELFNLDNSEFEYKIYSENEWNDIVSNDNIVNSTLIPCSKHIIWVCPNCKRAHIFEKDKMDMKYVYKLKECNVRDESNIIKLLHKMFKKNK